MKTLAIVDGTILVEHESGELGPHVAQGRAAIVPDSVAGIVEGERLFFPTVAATPVTFNSKQYYAVCVGDIIGKII